MMSWGRKKEEEKVPNRRRLLMGVELWANHMRIQLKCYWELLEEPHGNALGTRGENQLNKLSKYKLGEIS